MSRKLPNPMRYQGGNREKYLEDLAAKVDTLLTFANPCQHAPYPEGRSCEHNLGHSKYGDRGAPTEDQRKFEGTVSIPSKTTWVGSLNAGQKASLRGDKLPIVKVGDKYLAPPPATDHAAYRANQIGIGEMLQKDILKKVAETKNGDYHEEQRVNKDPRYDYTLADLPIKVGLTISKNGHVSTIIATHAALDREAKATIKVIRKQRLSPSEQSNRFKKVEQTKRAKALELMNEWRVAHKLQPVELIWS